MNTRDIYEIIILVQGKKKKSIFIEQYSMWCALKTKDSEEGGEGGGWVKVSKGAELSICYCVSSAIVT